MKTTIHPVGYNMIYVNEHYDRKQTVTVVASDAVEAFTIAEKHLTDSCKFLSAEVWKPRWVQSDTDVPDVISESVLRQYAAKLGFELVRPIDGGN